MHCTHFASDLFCFIYIQLIMVYVNSILPESLRWLLVKGKTKEAKKILINAGRINKKNITEDDLTLLAVDDKRGENGKEILGDVRSLFASRSLTSRTLVSWYCW